MKIILLDKPKKIKGVVMYIKNKYLILFNYVDNKKLRLFFNNNGKPTIQKGEVISCKVNEIDGVDGELIDYISLGKCASIKDFIMKEKVCTNVKDSTKGGNHIFNFDSFFKTIKEPVQRGKSKFYIVKFTQTQIRKHRNQYQIKMLNKFVNIVFPVNDSQLGGYVTYALIEKLVTKSDNEQYYALDYYGKIIPSNDYDNRKQQKVKQEQNCETSIDNDYTDDYDMNDIIEYKLLDEEIYHQIQAYDNVETQIDYSRDDSYENPIEFDVEPNDLLIENKRDEQNISNYNSEFIHESVNSSNYYSNHDLYEVSNIHDDKFATNLKIIKGYSNFDIIERIKRIDEYTNDKFNRKLMTK